MSTVRSLVNMFCANCSEVTMHRAERCIHCTEPNQQSGNPPVPRPPARRMGQRTPEGEQRRIEALRAYHAARRARTEHLSRRGQT